MPKFKAVFNKWAATYDEVVAKVSPADDWMFGGYDCVLDKVTEYCEASENNYTSVLEIGVGTGNLAARFLKPGVQVYGVDPSGKMRKVCKQKFPEIQVIPGDF